LHNHEKTARRRRKLPVRLRPPKILARPPDLVAWTTLSVLQFLGFCHAGASQYCRGARRPAYSRALMRLGVDSGARDKWRHSVQIRTGGILHTMDYNSLRRLTVVGQPSPNQPRPTSQPAHRSCSSKLARIGEPTTHFGARRRARDDVVMANPHSFRMGGQCPGSLGAAHRRHRNSRLRPLLRGCATCGRADNDKRSAADA
jgi:hypothetical protein